MSKLFNVNGVCELALRRVSEFAQHDMGADPDSLRVTLDAFEVLAAEEFATEEALWVQTEAAVIPIPANPGLWDFVTAAGPDVIDPNRFQIAKEAAIINNSSQNWDPLTLLSRQDYEKCLRSPYNGVPRGIFINREELLPKAAFDCNLAVTGYSLRLTWYATSPTYAVTGAHEFPRSWQRYMSLRLARDIGSGPVVRIPQNELNDLDTEIERAHQKLIAHHNVQTRTPSKVRPQRVQ